MFCIYQMDDRMNEKIIKVLNSVNDFLNTVRGTIPNNITVKSIESLTENDINLNLCFTEGYYLLINDKLIKFVHKYTKTNSGIVYNTKSLVTDILFTWKLLPFECDGYKVKNHHIFDTYSEDIFDGKPKNNLEKLTFDSSSFSEDVIDIKPKNNLEKLTFYSDSFSDILTDKEILVDKKENNFNCKYLSETKELTNPLPIKEFKLSNVPSTICIIAKRGSGKSWVIRDLITNLNKSDKFIENLLLISPTERMNKFYGKFISSDKILYEYDNKVLKKYFEKIKNMNKEEFKKFSGCVIFDDCLSCNGTWKKDPEIFELFLNARHYNITFILGMQYPMDLAHELRANFNYVFLLYDDFLTNQKKIYNQYAGMFLTFDLFRQCFRQLTTDFGSMVIKNSGTTLEEKIFHFKAKLIK